MVKYIKASRDLRLTGRTFWQHNPHRNFIFSKTFFTCYNLAVSSSPRPWMDVFVSHEKSNMAVTESDPDPKVRKITITF